MAARPPSPLLAPDPSRGLAGPHAQPGPSPRALHSVCMPGMFLAGHGSPEQSWASPPQAGRQGQLDLVDMFLNTWLQTASGVARIHRCALRHT